MYHCTWDCSIRKRNSQFVSLGRDIQVILHQAYMNTVKKDISNKETDKRKTNKGRRKSLAVRDERRLIHKLYELREREGSFTAPRLQLETRLTNCSIWTIHGALKKQEFSYLQTRRKGRMTTSDLNCRVKFANHIKKTLIGTYGRKIYVFI